MSFKSFINEIRRQDLDNIELDRKLFFDKLFGDKLRILIPLSSDNKQLNELILYLKQDGLIVNINDLINKKIIYKKVETKQGEKIRAEKVGGYLKKKIEKAEHLETKKLFERLLDWWQKNSEKLKNNDGGSSIIISRSPIDLVRMSDHDNITSCHSPDGSFFKCAKQEARTGGAVAFVVKNSDLKNLDIQKTEIFKDKERKIDGIVPLERLRLRRFNRNDLDLLVPELKTYGTKIMGFYDQVKSWAISSQKDIIEKLDVEKDYRYFDLKGGSYQDTDASKIWSNFFDKNVEGEKESVDEGDEEGNGDDIYEAAERQIREHQENWNHFNIHHDIYEENILDYNAYCSFSISIKLFTVGLSDSPFEVNDNEKKMYENWRKVKNIIEEEIDIYSINGIELNISRGKYDFNISIYDESNLSRGDNQLVRLEHFLDYIDDIDKNFEDHVSKVYKALMDKGYIKTVSEKITFKNFDVEEDDDGETTISSPQEKIGYLKDFPVVTTVGADSTPYWDKILYNSSNKIYINQFRNKFINSTDFKLLKIFPITIGTNNIELYLDNTASIRETEEKITIPEQGKATTKKITRITGWVYFKFNKILNVDITSKSNTKNIQLLKNLDNNWDFYIQRIAKFFDSFVKLETREFGWTKTKAPDFPFNNKKDFAPHKPTIKKPEYIQKTLNFKEYVLNEMPIKGFNLIGQWGPDAKRRYGYNDQDTGILENPKAVQKIHKSWSNSKFDFDFYFLRSYKANKHVEVGEVNLNWVKENLDLEIKTKEDHITVIFTNNRGSEKIPLTAWTLAHRLGHAIRKENIFDQYFIKQVSKDFKEILIYVYNLDAQKDSPLTPYYTEDKYKKSLFTAVGKMKSARENNLRNSNEFIYELVAQYIITGKITFNDLPRELITDRRMAWGRPNHKIVRIKNEEIYQEYNAQLHNNASVYEHYLDQVFGALVNKIFVM